VLSGFLGFLLGLYIQYNGLVAQHEQVNNATTGGGSYLCSSDVTIWDVDAGAGGRFFEVLVDGIWVL
jgi:hypothetical protein